MIEDLHTYTIPASVLNTQPSRQRIYDAVQKAYGSNSSVDWMEAGLLYQQIGDRETAEICFEWSDRLLKQERK